MYIVGFILGSNDHTPTVETISKVKKMFNVNPEMLVT